MPGPAGIAATAFELPATIVFAEFPGPTAVPAAGPLHPVRPNPAKTSKIKVNDVFFTPKV